MEQGVNEYTTCVVCLSEFDEVLHIPKFLQCHHIICVSCAEVNFDLRFIRVLFHLTTKRNPPNACLQVAR